MRYDKGGPVRYKGLGAGIVKNYVDREFLGKMCTFIVIDFPHRDMLMQVPLGDPITDNKLSKALSRTRANRLLKQIGGPGMTLARTWEERERACGATLQSGTPEELVGMLNSYALAAKNGIVLQVSDIELIRNTQLMIAADISCATGRDFAETHTLIRGRYTAAATPADPS